MPPKRSKGVTFKLVHQPYDDAENTGGRKAIMVEERIVRQHLPASGSGRGRRQRDDDDSFCDDGGASMSTVSRWAQEWDETSAPTERNAGMLEGEEDYLNRHNFLLAQDPDDDDDNNNNNKNKNDECADDGGYEDISDNDGGACEGVTKKSRSEAADGEEESSDDKLFDDQEEGEVTDEFLRQLVFGGEDDDLDVDRRRCGDDDDDDDDGNDDGSTNRDNVPASFVPHDTTRRAIDRQFTQLMREFTVDERLNDAYTDDPRTQGALDADQYLRAMEEFVVERAGIDYRTAEPMRNKGLIHQLKSMAYGVPTDMTASGDVITTTILPDKKIRFATEFKRETEEIRRAARERILRRQAEAQKNAADGEVKIGHDSMGASEEMDDDCNHDDGTFQVRNAAKANNSSECGSESQEEEEEGETYVVRRIVDKSNRLDCETVLSTYSTYFNQPNVIRAPDAGKKRKGKKVTQPHRDNNEGDDMSQEVPDLSTSVLSLAKGKNESKEEKKMRKQLVKDLKRERRGKKKELRQVYKTMEAEEARRVKESQTARKTLSFL
ncbi:hypothetical protein, conserved [Trypanosoma brucei brucei TREU927]|uniref:Protein LTV1 homolog n=1 Tax=Trypanosoma brucei brucei (strain 927/4 GUTat10.1) TaxID=185431 RepID=Q57WD1_TRYB2|nr:hypothetical protein, conserved [Trypanosoma brucei brucei TREU927]AAX70102.1 hypothetical protein, conserved [Trypanosoma brucei]AAZ10428.1 hypothetical protein, conserved [Trypanosoma brucei brucei TREU927]